MTGRRVARRHRAGRRVDLRAGRRVDQRAGRRGVAGERGSASLLVVALAGVVLMLGLAASFLTATAAAHRRAQGAADLAALAGATARQQGQDPCRVAARVATANGAGLADCRVVGADVVVSVTVDGPDHLGHGWLLVGEARAGPS